MIKKTLFLAVLLFILYSVFIEKLAPKWWSGSQHQWQDNVIKAQKYIYNNIHYTNVILGSSLSNRIINDSLENTYSLTFGGRSIFDGLNILLNTDKLLPKFVFIETNVVLRQEDESFTSSLYSLMFYPKKYVLALREDKQPIAVIGSLISKNVTKKMIGRVKAFFNNKINTTEKGNLFSKMLALQTEKYTTIPLANETKLSFDILKKQVTALEKRNVTVVFFEMPINYSLVHLPRAEYIRNKFYSVFPTNKYKYITPPENEKYISADGVHLTREEALKYTIYFKKQVDNLSLD